MSAGGASQKPDSLTALYRDVIRQHAAAPIGYRQPIEATHSHEAYNALCGDRVALGFRLEGETVQAAAFDGEACAICLASASLLCGLVPGRSVTQLRQLALDLETALSTRTVGADSSATGSAKTSAGAPTYPQSRMNPLLQAAETNLPEKLRPLLGVRPYPSRVRCATLPWEAAVAALGPPRG